MTDNPFEGLTQAERDLYVADSRQLPGESQDEWQKRASRLEAKYLQLAEQRREQAAQAAQSQQQ
jgi:hypothetical protein